MSDNNMSLYGLMSQRAISEDGLRIAREVEVPEGFGLHKNDFPAASKEVAVPLVNGKPLPASLLEALKPESQPRPAIDSKFMCH